MTNDFLLRGDLARAGRAFASVSIETIAADCGLGVEQIRHFERGGDNLNPEQRAALKKSLEKYGAMFIHEGDGYGYGARRRYPREKLMRLSTWEEEGGAWDRH